MEITWSHLKRAYFLSCIAGILGSVSDLLLLYTPEIRYQQPSQTQIDYHFLSQILESRIHSGVYLGLASIPFHVFGFLLVIQSLKKSSVILKALLGFLAILLLTQGITYHALLWPTFTFLNSPDLFNHWVSSLLRPLEMSIFISFVLISLLLAWEILQKRTLYTAKSLLFLPISTYLVFLILYALQLPGSNAIIAMGLNLSFLVFFTHTVRLLKTS
jgi:hypothetical protein